MRNRTQRATKRIGDDFPGEHLTTVAVEIWFAIITVVVIGSLAAAAAWGLTALGLIRV